MNENWNYKLTKCRIGDESLLLNSFQQRSLKPIPVDAIFRGLPAHHSKFLETLAQPTHTRLIPIDGYGPTSTTDQWSTWTANAAFSLSLSLSLEIYFSPQFTILPSLQRHCIHNANYSTTIRTLIDQVACSNGKKQRNAITSIPDFLTIR